MFFWIVSCTLAKPNLLQWQWRWWTHDSAGIRIRFRCRGNPRVFIWTSQAFLWSSFRSQARRVFKHLELECEELKTRIAQLDVLTLGGYKNMLHSAVLKPLRWDGGDSDSNYLDPDQNTFWSRWNLDSSGYHVWSQLILLSSGLTNVGSVDSLGRKATWMRVCFDLVVLPAGFFVCFYVSPTPHAPTQRMLFLFLSHHACVHNQSAWKQDLR